MKYSVQAVNDLYDEMIEYTKAMAEEKFPVNKMRKLAAERCLKDLENPNYILNMNNVFTVIFLIENTFKHIKGTLRNQPYLLEKWQKWIIFNLVGFEYNPEIDKDKEGERRFRETLIFVPRKNSKTFFASALAWALSLLERENNSVLYIIATKLDRAREGFNNIYENILMRKEDDLYKLLNSRSEYSISRTFNDGGKMFIQALASDDKNADGLNANVFILDEIHGYKTANQYFVYQEALEAYKNGLLLGITTAGTNINSFCYERLKYCKEVLKGTFIDEPYFIFICEADDPSDYANPYQHEIANPNYGVTIRPERLANKAEQAQHSSETRTSLLNKNLNIYTNSIKAYFSTEEFRDSNFNYNWSIKELSKLPIKWYGGVDLSKMHDLTAACLYGRYRDKNGEDIDITITHGFIPRTEAINKVEKSNIQIFGWEDDGWLTIQNTPTIHYDDVVKWFEEMRQMGFKIKRVGYDPKFASEFAIKMEKHRFKMKETPQLRINKSQGFRRIERQVKEGRFYYLGSQAYLYCVGNVAAVEDDDDFIKYSKIEPEMKIDLFDASVMACYEMLQDIKKKEELERVFKKR